MALKISGTRRARKKDFPKFDAPLYSKVALSALTVYSVHYLLEREINAAMEDVVSACFLLFPQKFALKKYPRWPDSAVVARQFSRCRNKGYLAANADLGFKLTAKGARLAQKVAKILGITLFKRAAKTQSAQPKTPVAKRKKKTKIAREEKTPTLAPIKKTRPVRSTKTPIAKREKTAEIIKKEMTLPPIPPKRSAPQIEKTIPAKPAIQIVQPIKARRTKPIKRPIWIEKINPPEPTVRSGGAEQAQLAQPEKKIVPAQSVATPEAKVRAGKFARMMETSDAYIYYKKNGKNSKISEFDFRSLLLCTMESSPETLARNVELFKGYATIHNRQDLIAFLNFCGDKFSHLLTQQKKQSKKSARK